MIDPRIQQKLLTKEDYEESAQRLGVEVEALQAVAEVESAGYGFQVQRDGTIAPKILFEPHIFSRLTGHKYDKTHPQISRRTWNRSAYGATLDQHPKLQEAVELDRNAALQSASWGKFQIMGFNWKQVGYKSLQEFINDMFTSEGGQLRAFEGFILSNPRILQALKKKNWATFAYYYNGPGYKKNNYNLKIAMAYARIKQTQ